MSTVFHRHVFSYARCCTCELRILNSMARQAQLLLLPSSERSSERLRRTIYSAWRGIGMLDGSDLDTTGPSQQLLTNGSPSARGINCFIDDNALAYRTPRPRETRLSPRATLRVLTRRTPSRLGSSAKRILFYLYFLYIFVSLFLFFMLYVFYSFR